MDNCSGCSISLYNLSDIDLEDADLQQPADIKLVKKDLLESLEDKRPKIIIIDKDSARNLAPDILERAGNLCTLIAIGRREDFAETLPGLDIFEYIEFPEENRLLNKTIAHAIRYLIEKERKAALEKELKDNKEEMNAVVNIGIALSAERDHEKLLNLILRKSRDITNADAGSLYLVEEKPSGEKHLRFKLVQNDSVKADFSEHVIPLDKNSMAGYVALTGETVNVEDAYKLSTFNRSFDEKAGYRTKSMLVIPMKDHRDKIIGVLQLINRKKSKDIRLTSPDAAEEYVVPFDRKCEDMVTSLASQAAVAIENNALYESIKRLFEGFVTASVTAIEQRDPTTSGHSTRVATLSVGIAERVDRIDEGKFKHTKFTKNQIIEIKYAAILHDFGKIGVRENVLVKAAKLYPYELDLIRARFEYIKLLIKLGYTEKKIDYLLRHGINGYEKQFELLEKYMKGDIEKTSELFRIIEELNKPVPQPDHMFQKLDEISRFKFRDLYGEEKPYLNEREVKVLSIRKGSLDEEEKLEIESHVTHTFNFLKKIPWTPELKNVPVIAYAHHEKEDGSGYPNMLVSDEIPLQSKMITIADIYDALTAWDRPYKKAVPPEKALDIISDEARRGQLDPELVRIFIDAKIYELVRKK